MRNTNGNSHANIYTYADGNADSYTHKHSHTHTLGYSDPHTERYPHSHFYTAGPDDAHAHTHNAGELHTHLGDALSTTEYWRRIIRWWWHRLATRYIQCLIWVRSSLDLLGDSRRNKETEITCQACRGLGVSVLFGMGFPCPVCRIVG